MKYKVTALVLILSFLLIFSGCGEVVGEIAGNVADAAAKELEAQIKETVEEYKVEVIEIKSAVGKLDNEVESSQQFFCGVLVRSNSDALPQAATVTLGKIFDEAGCHPWHKSEIDNDHLVNKTLTFKHTDFSGGDYYLIWGYTPALAQKLTDALESIELPSIPDSWLPSQSADEGVG